MMIIGLTGSMGTGKTTTANIFREMGAVVIDADRIARAIVEPQMPAWQQLIDAFGDRVLNPDSTIDRIWLGELVFNDRLSRERLNQITHPLIREEIHKQIRVPEAEGKSCRSAAGPLPVLPQNSGKIMVIDAPLLIEAGIDSIADKIIVVITSADVQKERLKMRDSLSDLQIKARLDAQLPLEDKIEKADYIIDNNGTVPETAAQIKRIWEELIKDDEKKTNNR